MRMHSVKMGRQAPMLNEPKNDPKKNSKPNNESEKKSKLYLAFFSTYMEQVLLLGQ